MDRVEFLEALEDLAVYAEKNGNLLTKTEVEERFRKMELDESQYDLIYRYLFEKKITIQGILQNDWKEPDQEQKGQEDIKYLTRYLQELQGLPRLSEDQRNALALRLLAGEEEVLPDLLNASLYQVVELAERYQGRGVFFEDLIQEGNLMLVQVLKELCGKRQQKEVLRYIKEAVQCAMEEYIDGQMAAGGEEEKVVAKLALLHEAAKALSKENGTLPSAKELSEYARIPEEEIRAIANLSKDLDFCRW